MKILLLIAALGALAQNLIAADAVPGAGMASWYGEDHRGRLMANGRPFNPDKLTAASWFYPLGSKVQVTVRHPHKASRNVLVTITDRGPAKDLVDDGRIIDLTAAAFKRLAHPGRGLVAVSVHRVR